MDKLVKHDNRVECWDKEVDGYFVYTNNGWCWGDDGCHTRSFDKVKEILKDVYLIKPCTGMQGCCRGELDRG